MPVRVWAINGITPVIDPSAYVHPSAVLIGDVIVGAGKLTGKPTGADMPAERFV